MRTIDQRVCNFNFRYMYWNHVEKIWQIGTGTELTTTTPAPSTPATTGDYLTCSVSSVCGVHQSNYCQVTPPCSLWAAGQGPPASRWRSSPPPPAQQRTAPSSLCQRGGITTPSTRGRSAGDTTPAPAASGSSLTVAGPRPSHSNNPG